MLFFQYHVYVCYFTGIHRDRIPTPRNPEYVGRGIYFQVKNKADTVTTCSRGKILPYLQEKESVVFHSF